MSTQRIKFLDGYRGIAILLVVFYHAFARWQDLVPYGGQYSTIPLFHFGYVGVNLFFLISGFVILMSLESSKDLLSFIFKRWKRLFPAMLIATLLIYFTVALLPERPRGIPFPRDVFPGLLFLEPDWLRLVFKMPFKSIEGSFWSLFVEVKFYIVFGAAYFFLGKNKAIFLLVILYLASAIVSYLPIPFANRIIALLSLKHFCYFAGGCFAYLFFTTKENKYLLFCILICSVEIIRINLHFHSRMFAEFITLAFFCFPLYFQKFQYLFANKILVFFGFISYPLYLIHENAMIALILKLDKLSHGSIPSFILPIIPISGLILISFIIAKYMEPFIKKLIDKIVGIILKDKKQTDINN